MCLAAFLIPIVIYIATLNPALFRNDSPEVVVGCNSLGIIHAPGYPLFMLAGRWFSLLNLGNPAMTLNLFAALLGAFATLLFFLNLRFFLKNSTNKSFTTIPPILADLICLTTTLNFSLSRTFWGNALATKGGIYVLQIVLELSTLLAAQSLIANREKPKLGICLLFVFLFALGFCNHWPTQALLSVLVILIVYYMKIKNQLKPINLKNIVLGTVFFLCALSLYLYLPIRACTLPAIDFEAPTNLNRFIETIARTSYLKIETLVTAPVGYYSTLFYKMEYISDHTLHEFCPLFTVFTLMGIVFLFKNNKILCLSALGFMGVVLFTNIFYLQASPIEYWHIGDHLLTNNWVLGFLGGAGMLGLISETFLPKKYITLFLIVCILPWAAINGFQTNNQTRQFLYEGYGRTALKSLPQDSVYFTETDYDYFSVLYLTKALKLRPDIYLILTPFLDKPYQFENALAGLKPLFTEKDETYNKGTVFKTLTAPFFHHPVFCTFPDAGFSGSYLSFHSKVVFEPCGVLIHILLPNEKPIKKSDFVFLSDFYDHYLASETNHPNEINGLLREICAHPLLNAARYEILFGNNQHRNWYYRSALNLITEQDFFETVLREFKNKKHSRVP